MVGRQPIRLDEHLVIDLGVGESNLPAEQVVGDGFPVAGHAQTDDVLLAFLQPLPHLVGGERPTQPVIAELALLPPLLLAQRIEPRPGAEARVGGA
jgi:hypothetical protein